MYQPMLFIHWKQARLPLLPFVVAAFGLPLLSIQGLFTVFGESSYASAYSDLATLSLPIYPALAFLTGVVLALTAWNWDHQLNHVYALSLPLARWEYAMLKMGAGLVLALIPAFALWIGASGLGCLALPGGTDAWGDTLAEAGECLAFLLKISAPLLALMLFMLWRVAPLMPWRVVALGGLASTGAAASLLALVHPHDAALLDLGAHAIAIVAVLAVGAVAARLARRIPAVSKRSAR